jgi:plasmid stabilization system protein ParE
MPGQYQISFAHSAVSDLEDVLAFYKEQKIPQVGERLVKKTIQEIELLSEQPDMGRMVPVSCHPVSAIRGLCKIKAFPLFDPQPQQRFLWKDNPERIAYFSDFQFQHG